VRRRQNPDNLHNRIVGPCGELIGVHVTPHMLRRTFASFLAEIGVPPRRAMYLLGHKDPKFTMAVFQHVLDVSADTDKHLTDLLGCNPDEAFVILSGRSAGAATSVQSGDSDSESSDVSGRRSVGADKIRRRRMTARFRALLDTSGDPLRTSARPSFEFDLNAPSPFAAGCFLRSDTCRHP
jgi:Phage integrase family